MKKLKKIVLGLIITGLVLFTIFLYNLGQRNDREYPSFKTEPEKNAGTIHDSIPLRDVVVVGNNWDGVITIFDPVSYEVIKKISAMPDREERFEEIYSGLKRRLAAGFIREFIGEHGCI